MARVSRSKGNDATAQDACQALLDGVSKENLDSARKSFLVYDDLKGPAHPYSRSKDNNAMEAHEDLLMKLVTLGPVNKSIYVEGLKLYCDKVVVQLGTPTRALADQVRAMGGLTIDIEHTKNNSTNAARLPTL